MKHFVPALLMVLVAALLPARAGAANVPTRSSDEAHPLVMQQAAEEVASAKPGLLQPFTAAPRLASIGGAGGLQREIFGFGLASSLSDPNIGYPSWDFGLLSTVAFFGLSVADSGAFNNDPGWTVWNSNQLTGLLTTAHAAGTKVVLTVILQDFSSGTPHMCSALANRSAVVSQTVAQVSAKGVDGVNLDFEGLNGTCPNGQTPRAMLTDFVHQLRAALPAGSYLSVDTYASSAGDPAGFYDIPGLNPNLDAFFVMAYDSEYSNYQYPPLNCSSFCLGPTAPLTGYHYNDTVDMSQYTSAVAASKVILGVPYYGRKACVASATPNQYPQSYLAADGYQDAIGESGTSQVQPGSYAVHRDANDPAGQERWDTWYNTSLNCTRELYWDDTTSLGLKYDLVNKDNLRGVGLWNLNFGGGAPELWNELNVKFGTSTPWYTLGGAATSSTVSTSWSSSRYDIFVKGTDNAIYHRVYDGSWHDWESMGGVGTSNPAAISWGPGRIDLFVRGTDNGLYHRVYLAGSWYPWEGLGCCISAGPTVASWGQNRLDVFVRGMDNGLYHRVWTGSYWSQWESLGGPLASDPTAVSWAYNRVDVFSRAADNTLQHKWWDGTGWHGWASLSGALTSAPAASSCSSGHLDVFVLGSDSAAYQLGYNGTTWGSWQRLGGRWTTDPGAACRVGTSSVDLLERGQDNAVWVTSTPGT